jgi:hypothetical protein
MTEQRRGAGLLFKIRKYIKNGPSTGKLLVQQKLPNFTRSSGGQPPNWLRSYLHSMVHELMLNLRVTGSKYCSSLPHHDVTYENL